MAVVNINTDGLVKYSRQLDLMRKSALPRAARNTLNNVAFDVKERTLPEEADKSFTIRNRPFYKRFSKVKMAQGSNIRNMKAIVGMNVQGAPSTARQAIDDQAQQQLTGTIGGRTLIPFDEARVGGKHNRNIQARFRADSVDVQLDTANSKGATEKERFIDTIATGVERFAGGVIIKHQLKNGKEIIFHAKKGGKDVKLEKFSVKLTLLYSVKKGRSVKIRNAKPFTMNAADRSMRGVRRFWKKNATREINRLRR